MKGVAPSAKVVMLTISDEGEDLFEAIRAGASGYLLKDIPLDELPTRSAPVTSASRSSTRRWPASCSPTLPCSPARTSRKNQASTPPRRS